MPSRSAPQPQTNPQLKHFQALATDTQRFTVAVAKMAALLHDLGKANLAFQEKLTRGCGAESLRHDFVSFGMLEHCAARFATDDELIECLARNPQHFFAEFGWANRSKLINAESLTFKAAMGELENPEGRALFTGKAQFEERPIFYSVAWLVLTHHRLPKNTYNNEACGFEEHINRIRESDSSIKEIQAKAKALSKAHQRAALDEDALTVEVSTTESNRSAFYIAPVEDCICLPDDKNPTELPWISRDWLNAVAQCAKTIQETKSSLNTMPDTVWIQALAHQLRPALMLADHLDASAPRDNGLMEDASDLILANTYPVKKGEAPRAGSTLIEHLLAVGDNIETILTFLLQRKRFDFPQANLKSHALIFNQNLSERFSWQRDLSDAVQSIQLDNDEPVFIGVMSETGAGKTLGGPRALHALNSDGKLRYTNALGRRSLASQSAMAYQQGLGLDDDELALVLGTNNSTVLRDETARYFDTLKSPSKGSESSAPDLSAPIAQGSTDLSWLGDLAQLDVLNRYWTEKHKKLLSTPVVSCTIDHLIGAANTNRSSDSKLYLRLATAPLILDEVDDLQGTDSQIISKLCLIQGLNGQSVVLMSATMGPEIFAGAFRMWSIGMQYYRAMHSTTEEITVLNKRAESLNKKFNTGDAYGNLIITSNTGKPAALPMANLKSGQKAWSDMAKAHTEAVSQKNKIVGTEKRPGIRKNLIPGSRQQVFQQVLNTCAETAADNYTVDPETKCTVALGLLRLKTAKMAQRLAKNLTKQDLYVADDVHLLIVNCHARHPAAHQNALDNALLRVCNRKNGLEYLQEPLLRSAIEEAHRLGKTHVVILAVSSSIMETGKDLDFDFAVSDPLSDQKLIQLAGRVGRHRQFDAKYPNVVVLEDQVETLIVEDFEPKKRPFAYPGIEDESSCLKITRATPDYVKESSSKYKAEWNESLSGKTGREAYLAKHHVTSAAQMTERQKDVSALPMEFFLEHGINSGVCLDRLLSYQQNKVGEATHAVAYFNHNEEDFKPELHPVPSMANYVIRGRVFNSWHLDMTPFRKKEGEQITLSMDENGQGYYFDAHSESFVPLPNQINSHLENERFFIRDLDKFANEILGKFDEQERLHMNAVKMEWDTDPLLTLVHWHPQIGFILKKMTKKD